MQESQKTGTIYFERHLRRHNASGDPVYYPIWTAEVIIRGTKYRRKSKSRTVCEQWLHDVELYLKGEGEFPARLTHPGEDPLSD